MQRLRQGIGRAIRKRSDAATIWIADPRFGLPDSVADRELLVSHYPKAPILHACIPKRFRHPFQDAEIFPAPVPLKVAAE